MAIYDDKPSKLEAVGNGSYLYRFNIGENTSVVEEATEVEKDTENEQEAPELKTWTHWKCEEVTIFEPLTANKITEAVISTVCPSSHEQKLVNEYNAANLGMIGGSKTSDEAKQRIAAYKEFLEYRNALKTQVDADCEELGIR